MQYPCSMILGNFGQAPEMRYTPNGNAVTTCDIAQYAGKDKNGNKKTTWYRCVFWRELAEEVNKKLLKGNRALVTGKIQPIRLYEAKDGSMKASQDIEVATIKVVNKQGTILWEASAFENSNQPEKAVA